MDRLLVSSHTHIQKALLRTLSKGSLGAEHQAFLGIVCVGGREKSPTKMPQDQVSHQVGGLLFPDELGLGKNVKARFGLPPIGTVQGIEPRTLRLRGH
jgi:hypothetical protein